MLIFYLVHFLLFLLLSFMCKCKKNHNWIEKNWIKKPCENRRRAQLLSLIEKNVKENYFFSPPSINSWRTHEIFEELSFSFISSFLPPKNNTSTFFQSLHTSEDVRLQARHAYIHFSISTYLQTNQKYSTCIISMDTYVCSLRRLYTISLRLVHTKSLMELL
jgi:hypothetical protein